MTPASEKRRDKFFALVRRFIQLGCLLPAPEDLDAGTMDQAELVLAEMHKTKAEMDRVLDQENASRKASA